MKNLKPESNFLSNQDYIKYLKKEGINSVFLTPQIEKMLYEHNSLEYQDNSRYELRYYDIDEDRFIFEFILMKYPQASFQYFKDNKDLLNISEIERRCSLKRTSLLNAVNRNQKSYSQSEKLVPIYLQLVSS